MAQLLLFDDPGLPEGFRYRSELITAADEAALLRDFGQLDFKPFEFQGFLGLRRVVSFGWRYDFNHARMSRVDPIPDWLMPLRAAAAGFAGCEAERLEHVLINEYRPGAPIGWHRDRPQFAEVIGVSLASDCDFRFRLKDGASWRRAIVRLAARSAYLLTGPARWEWEHSIGPARALRYSITFRTLA